MPGRVLANLAAPHGCTRATSSPHRAEVSICRTATASVNVPLRPAISQLDRDAAQRAEETRASSGSTPSSADAAGLRRFAGRAVDQLGHRPGGRRAARRRCAGVACDRPEERTDLPDGVGAPGEVPYVVVPYVEQMQYAYAAADFALCRCGAMTCAELSAVGLPAAYVPYPVGNGEQRFNAVPIVACRRWPARRRRRSRRRVDHGQRRAADHRSRRRWQRMSAAAESAGSRDADVVLARHVLTVVPTEYRRFPTAQARANDDAGRPRRRRRASRGLGGAGRRPRAQRRDRCRTCTGRPRPRPHHRHRRCRHERPGPHPARARRVGERVRGA